MEWLQDFQLAGVIFEEKKPLTALLQGRAYIWCGWTCLVKLPFQYNQFTTDLYSEYSSGVNIFSINKFQKMECDLYVDRIWRMNDKFYMKWKCKIIHLV